MSSLRASKSSAYQLYASPPALGHRVEAEGGLALGRELGEQAGLAHARRGCRRRTRRSRSARRRTASATSPAAAASVWKRRSRQTSGPSAISPRSALWPEQGHRDHLVAVGLGGAHGLAQGVRVEVGRQPAEEVQDAPAGRRGQGHAVSVENERQCARPCGRAHRSASVGGEASPVSHRAVAAPWHPR